MNPKEWDEAIKKLADSVRDLPVIRTDVYDKVAVIVEPRNLNVISDLLVWMVHLLSPKGWHVIVYHGNLNLELVRSTSVSHLIEFRSLDKDNLTIQDYSNLLKTIEFWELIRFENILIFQTDSVLLDNNLDEFLKYDFVGAPFTEECVKLYNVKQPVGNGGLSLRKRTAMLKVLSLHKKYPRIIRRRFHNFEDVFFTNYPLYIMVCPTKEVAMDFSVECIWHNNPKGYHKPWLYLEKEKMDQVYENILSFSKTNETLILETTLSIDVPTTV